MNEEIEIEVLNEFLAGLLKANEIRAMNSKLEKENKRLKVEKTQLQIMYNELMDKNLKLQKIIDALMEK